jgi:hypothetical protein
VKREHKEHLTAAELRSASASPGRLVCKVRGAERVEDMWSESLRCHCGNRREKEAREWLDYRSCLRSPRLQVTLKGRGREGRR